MEKWGSTLEPNPWCGDNARVALPELATLSSSLRLAEVAENPEIESAIIQSPIRKFIVLILFMKLVHEKRKTVRVSTTS